MFRFLMILAFIQPLLPRLVKVIHSHFSMW